jgi:hypothetical protein
VKARAPVDFLKLGRYKFQLKEIPLQLKQLDVAEFKPVEHLYGAAYVLQRSHMPP